MTETTRLCEICARPIDPERADLLPDTRLCVEHARMIGKYGGEFTLRVSRISLGKSGSLKKNYGDFSAYKRRNTEGMKRLWEEVARAAAGELAEDADR
jgi:hypothetical protein